MGGGDATWSHKCTGPDFWKALEGEKEPQHPFFRQAGQIRSEGDFNSLFSDGLPRRVVAVAARQAHHKQRAAKCKTSQDAEDRYMAPRTNSYLPPYVVAVPTYCM